MRPLSSLGIGLSLVSGCLFLALVAELYYLLWWKKRSSREVDHNYRSPAGELLYLCCCWKPSSLSSTALNPQDMTTSVDTAAYSDEGQLQLRSDSSKDLLLKAFGGEDGMEAELMRLHGLAGPPRFLFTIKEETKEELESEDGRSRGGRSRRSSRGKSLSELFVCSDTPLASPPLFTPPLTPLDCYKQSGFNPLFESTKEEDFIKVWSSPPPKFKFLKDAEEKLHRKRLMEEASKVHRNGGLVNSTATQESHVSSHPPGVAASHPSGPEEEDGSFITIVIGKNRDRGQQHHSSSSQVIPLPSSPSSFRPVQGRRSSSI
ncbi:hypothetical protein B296_00050203 [Ensete ventricosum]|uniref:Uncharacterized protein n=1 Tax=Ensete ventricosum TaxID=4639 RepID=A0A426XWT8_ENSVE|nr:hypothetical protein B296_00050203 [Ensete ventricosum]